MKLISFYLPQFHEIPENNDAWGKGFTEWTNVKKTKPLFIGHNQPRVPYNNNYYNLLDNKVMKWQSELARAAGIYGFCFYHYWFEGRMVLEKPVENLLKNKNNKIKFCFAWANEAWTKTWHGAGGTKEIFLPQTYGGKKDWREHYDYFRQFFLDERYIKENNKPIILIYRLRNIPQFNDMLKYWNCLAQEDGFDGVFVISMNAAREHVSKSRWVNGSVDFEPNYTKTQILNSESFRNPDVKRRFFWNRFAMKKIYYKKLCKQMLRKPHEKNHFRTMFINYDDSPRRGVNGVVTMGSTPFRFGKYLRKTIELSQIEGNNYVFINAWNEWGEGNYLEPDKKYSYKYLKEVKKCIKKIETQPNRRNIKK